MNQHTKSFSGHQDQSLDVLKGEMEELEAQALAILSVDPKSIEAWDVIASIAVQKENYEEAEMAYRCVDSLAPDQPLTKANLSKVCFWQKNFEGALEFIVCAINLDPTPPDFYRTFNVIGNSELSIDDSIFGFVVEKLTKAIESPDRDSALYIELYELWKMKGETEPAITAGLMALHSNESDVQFRLDFALFLRQCGRLAWAAKLFAELVEEAPDNYRGWLGYGICHNQIGGFEIARQAYEKVLELDPDNVSATKNLASAIGQTGNWNESLKYINRALELKPDDFNSAIQRNYLMRWESDWSDDRSSELEEMLWSYEGSDISPFHSLCVTDSPALQQKVAKQWAIDSESLTSDDVKHAKNEKIRIGWFSNDFHDHATMHLLAGVFREYDRERFEFYIYSYARPHEDHYVDLCRETATKYIDILGMDDRAVVNLARADALDVAVDLKGFTNSARIGLFAARVAPVQICYLGFPGTTGKSFYEYAIVDRVVVPEAFRDYFTEPLMFMPNCYQPNDSLRPIADISYQRSDFGLPEDAFVFACFNQTYKYDYREFKIWMKLLAEVEGSVLWLYVTGEDAQLRLRHQAEQMGIDLERIVFAGNLNNSEHLARCQLADLFLDCFVINAHTTASDALWAGRPILTKTGKQFAARVATSILKAADLEELVTSSDSEYFSRAKEIATNENFRSAIGNKISNLRSKSKLYDTAGYTRDLEKMLSLAVERSRAGVLPADIEF